MCDRTGLVICCSAERPRVLLTVAIANQHGCFRTVTVTAISRLARAGGGAAELDMSDKDDRRVPVTTTGAGTPAPSDEYSLTVGPDGPIPDHGIEFFPDAEAKAMTAEDPDYHLRDLDQTIERGEHPTWTLKMQIMPFEEAADYRFNPFDLTKVWPHGDYPLVTVGRLVLDRNPENYFAEVEQAAFEPAETVPGIGFSPDKMLLGRLFSYTDTHRYRIGTNYLQLPVNAPKVEVHSYNKDGQMRYRHNGAQPVYAPNSYGGPRADPQFHAPRWYVEGGRDHAVRVHEAPGRRRLRPGRDAVPQSARRCR
jgi:catalase